MNPIQESTCEQISALADGALKGDALARAVDALCADDGLQTTWQTYHAVGDLLRSGTRQPCTDSSAFLARFQQRLAVETPLAANPEISPTKPVPSVVTPLSARRAISVKPGRSSTPVGRIEAANEPVFRWKLVAGVASLAAAAAIGWNWMDIGAPSSGAQLAQQQAQPDARDPGSVLAAVQVGASSSGSVQSEPTRVLVGSNDPQVMLRDARLDQLIEAHRQAGGAAQMPSGFLRNATFDGSSR